MKSTKKNTHKHTCKHTYVKQMSHATAIKNEKKADIKTFFRGQNEGKRKKKKL